MRLIDYNTLVAKGIVNSRMTLKRLIDDHGFPCGQLITPNARRWNEDLVDEWVRIARRRASHRPACKALFPPSRAPCGPWALQNARRPRPQERSATLGLSSFPAGSISALPHLCVPFKGIGSSGGSIAPRLAAIVASLLGDAHVTVLGIDPGAHGAIAVLDETGDLLEVAGHAVDARGQRQDRHQRASSCGDPRPH